MGSFYLFLLLLLFQVTSESACRLACEIETEFLCRSFLYLGTTSTTAYNCRLYHLDHNSLPDGPSTYLNAERPLIDDGDTTGTYFENHCDSKYFLNLAFHIVSFYCRKYGNEITPLILYKRFMYSRKF